MSAGPVFTLPDRSQPCYRRLTRSEIARLVWACYRSKGSDKRAHLVRFIPIFAYAGTRHGAAPRLQWMLNTKGRWADLETGVLSPTSDCAGDQKPDTAHANPGPPAPSYGPLAQTGQQLQRTSRHHHPTFGKASGKTVWATERRSATSPRPRRWELLDAKVLVDYANIRANSSPGLAQRAREARSYMVGVAGFEPATPSSRTRCATRLRYTP